MSKKLLGFFIVSLLFSCNTYKQTSVSSDVFLSHKIWKENYQEYVYLVHDDSSVMQLKDVKLQLDSNGNEVDKISGDLVPYVEDSLEERNSTKSKTKKRETIDIYVVANNDLNIEEGGIVALEERDIQKVRLQTKKNVGVLGVIGIGLGIIVGIILLLFLILLLIILGSSGGGGSSSNSDPQCYIATMVYGSSDTEQVLLLRGFRDSVLLKTTIGRTFVRWYYANSPGFVKKHKGNVWLHKSIKTILDVFVGALKLKK